MLTAQIFVRHFQGGQNKILSGGACTSFFLDGALNFFRGKPRSTNNLIFFKVPWRGLSEACALPGQFFKTCLKIVMKEYFEKKYV